MKKLVIAAAIVCAAAFAQAATYTWGFYSPETVAPDGQYFGEGSYANASAFLYLGTVELVDGQFNFGTAQYLASVQGYDTTDYNWGDFKAPGSSSSSLVNEKGGDAYTLILVSDGGITDLTQYTTGNAIVKTGTSVGKCIPGAGETVYYASMVNDTAFTAGAWQEVGGGPEPTPEPTSAILMALGLAGLALRRKQK